jgi:hypothetical protein
MGHPVRIGRLSLKTGLTPCLAMALRRELREAIAPPGRTMSVDRWADSLRLVASLAGITDVAKPPHYGDYRDFPRPRQHWARGRQIVGKGEPRHFRPATPDNPGAKIELPRRRRG